MLRSRPTGSSATALHSVAALPMETTFPGPRNAPGEPSTIAREPLAAVAAPTHQFVYDVAIVGMGYVGLPTALAFTAAGRSVLGVDLSRARLGDIAEQRVDLIPGDRERLADALAADLLTLEDSAAGISEAAAVVICVPTPVDRHLVPDLAALKAACASTVAQATAGQLIVLTSTTYVGTTRDLLIEPLRARGFSVGADLCVAFSPERIDPANETLAHEDVPRVVGGETPECTARAAAFLRGYVRSVHCVSSPETAEMTKLLENTFRAVNIALVNELADMSEALGVRITEVIDAASTKPYGFMAFTPGPGVGGHCIPCDPHYLLWQLRESRLSLPLVERAMDDIASRPRHVVRRIGQVLADHGRPVRGARVLVVGVAYKPGVSDVRESPALEILAELQQQGAEVSYYDPLVPALRMPAASVIQGVDRPADGAPDLVLLHTLHPGVDYDWVAGLPVILDATFRFTQAPHRAYL